jgi:hypothetical protein
MAQKKTIIIVDPNKRKAKHTSQGNGKSSNTFPRGKHKKKQFKRYRGQG